MEPQPLRLRHFPPLESLPETWRQGFTAGRKATREAEAERLRRAGNHLEADRQLAAAGRIET